MCASDDDVMKLGNFILGLEDLLKCLVSYQDRHIAMHADRVAMAHIGGRLYRIGMSTRKGCSGPQIWSTAMVAWRRLITTIRWV
jgi:hypothetical protein